MTNKEPEARLVVVIERLSGTLERHGNILREELSESAVEAEEDPEQ